jgi:hypothetical protein
MKQLPASPKRYHAALVAWIIITVLAVGAVLYRLIVGPRDLIWLGIGGLGSLIGIWRWIAEAHRARTSRDVKDDTA